VLLEWANMIQNLSIFEGEILKCDKIETESHDTPQQG
jgi:hypothetical protein